MCAPALTRRGDVAPSRRPGGGAPVPLPPVRLHSAAGPHLPAAPRPLPSVGPYGLRAERLRATPALFFRLHAVLNGYVASVIRSLDAWWVWARVAVTCPTKRPQSMEHSGVRSVVAGDGVGGKCSVYAITTAALVVIPTLHTHPRHRPNPGYHAAHFSRYAPCSVAVLFRGACHVNSLRPHPPCIQRRHMVPHATLPSNTCCAVLFV